MSMHKMLIASLFALGYPMKAGINFADDEGSDLSIIELEENLSDAEKPPVLPAGNYTGEIQDVQVATSQKGNEYFNIKFVVPTDEVPAEMADAFEDGAVLYYNRIIKPKRGDRRALYNLRKFIESLGLPTETTTINPNDWMGQRARLKVRNTVFEGEQRAEIAGVESAEAPSSKSRTTQTAKEEAPKAATGKGRARR